MAEEGDRASLLKYLDDRFGIPAESFDDYLVYSKKRTFWFIHNSTVLSEAAHLKIKRLGIKAFQEVGRFIKPTTRIIQCFGHLANKAVFEINETELRQLLDGEQLPMDGELENGYVIISLKGQILGLGLIIKGLVRSQLPKEDVRYFDNRMGQDCSITARSKR